MSSSYKRGKVWWIKYHLGGTRIQQSLHTTNERIAKAKKSQFEYKLATGGLVLPSETSIREFLEGYCQYLKTIRSRKSYKNDISYLRTFFGSICPSLKPGHTGNKNKQLRKKKPKKHDILKGRHVRVSLLEQVSTALVSQFISHRVQKDGIAPKTANRLREVLHRMFSYAIKEKNYRGFDGSRENPISAVERRIEGAPNISFLNIAEIKEQLKILEKNPTLKAMVATYIYAGLRREEALWLTVNDVDLEKKLIYVRAKEINGEFWQPKTKRNRVVAISSTLHEILSTYSPERNCLWFFPSTLGKRWDPDNFSEVLRKINRKKGLKWHCLDFRHTFGSQLAQKGESLYKIAELMGNSPAICRKHYAALIPEKMHDTVEFGVKNASTNNPEEIVSQIIDALKSRESEEVKPQLRIVG